MKCFHSAHTGLYTSKQIKIKLEISVSMLMTAVE